MVVLQSIKIQIVYYLLLYLIFEYIQSGTAKPQTPAFTTFTLATTEVCDFQCITAIDWIWAHRLDIAGAKPDVIHICQTDKCLNDLSLEILKRPQSTKTNRVHYRTVDSILIACSSITSVRASCKHSAIL
jgi:hypothetical protein